MKAIIGSERYDSGKATLIGAARRKAVRHCDGADFMGRAELYRTSKGAYFVRGDGIEGSWFNDISEYEGCSPEAARNCERLYVLDRDQAFGWAREYLDVDEIEAEFADMIEDA